MNLSERIKAGVEGKYQGLDNGFNRVNDYIFGIQRGVYILLGGMSGTFKTTIADYMVLNAIRDAEAKGLEFNIFYYSFEIDELSKKCNWLSNIIYNKYDMIIPPQKIKGFGNNKLNSDELELVMSEIDYVDNLFKKIKFKFKALNPTGIHKELFKFAETNGKFDYYEYTDDSGKVLRSPKAYYPNNSEVYNLVVLDHMALLHKERGFQTKEVIDKYSEYCVLMRNLCNFSFINIQQFNQGLSSVERSKFKGIDLSPQQSDFRDSTNPYQDCDIALGLMNPYKMDMATCLGYDINKLKQNMIMLKIIKNRLSLDNIAIGLHANASAGSFSELPKSNEINYDDYK